MNKLNSISRLFAVVFLSCSINTSFSQQWEVVTNSDLSEMYSWSLGNFAINPYDNTMWFSFGGRIYSLDNNGQYTVHNNSTDPTIPAVNVHFKSTAFTPNKIYMAEGYSGYVLSFDGVDWSVESSLNDAEILSSDGDTVWVCPTTGGVVTLEAGTPITHIYGADRIQSKNGVAYSASGLGGGYFDSYLRKYIKDVMPIGDMIYNADTINFLLSNTNHDFKFANNSDTLFTSGDRGFSLAINHEFVDTITANNTLNMPTGKIVQFEFDANDNIWALFGDNTQSVEHIAFLDRSINEWTVTYDINNSPMDYTALMKLQIDIYGNPFIMQSDRFYYLNVNNVPQWLGSNELSVKKKQVVKILDVLGREAENMPNTLLLFIYNDGTTEKVFRVE